MKNALAAAMTPEEARSLLRRNNICPIHGCEMTKQPCDEKDRWKYAPEFRCRQCDLQNAQQDSQQIAEAKKVLGLK